ncbi:MAG TPA: D-2-hydroxyacid dehydrogenase [Longimicrobiales bacterium]|nr:D-2-hydroxyacid dehydrogenase [Longimicrobiales bacterium]
MQRRLVLNLRDRRPIWEMPASVVDAVTDALPGWEVVVPAVETDGTGDGMSAAPPELLETVRGAELYFGFGMPRNLFLEATTGPDARLRWVHSGSAGVRSTLYPEMRESDVVLTNSAGIHGPPIAETVLGMVLYFARGLDFGVAAQHEGRWNQEPFYRPGSPLREVSGATLGILGLGGIGRDVASRALALGMRVLASRRRPGEAPAGVELALGEDGLSRVLRESDYVVVALPDTPDTRGLLSAARLDEMRPDAVLINISRGTVVDEGALAERLAAGRLRGAGLDVFEKEPLSPDSPLWRLPNVLILPHVSPVSPRFWRREAELILENIRRYLEDRPLLNVVDKRSGY